MFLKKIELLFALGNEKNLRNKKCTIVVFKSYIFIAFMGKPMF